MTIHGVLVSLGAGSAGPPIPFGRFGGEGRLDTGHVVVVLTAVTFDGIGAEHKKFVTGRPIKDMARASLLRAPFPTCVASSQNIE